MELVDNSWYIMSIIATLIFWCISAYYRCRYSLHIIQLEEYKNDSYVNWTKQYGHKLFPRKITIGFIVTIIVFAAFILTSTYTKVFGLWLAFVVFWLLVLLFSSSFKTEKAKKDLVYTPRAKRLLVANFVIYALEILIVLVIYFFIVKYYRYYYPFILFILSVIYFYIPYNMVLANILVSPLEKRINRYYYNTAYKKVRSFENLKIVGITGSYGKTSTKFITAQILEEKFNVLKTPESYNTPMGISKVINNTLDDSYEAFVVEMGARRIGEIKEVAQLSNPKIGIITSIGPVHLETFKDMENIAKTKYELIEELPPEGIAIFNYDNEYVRKLADKTFKEKILYGMEDIENLDIFATDIEVSQFGSSFILGDKEGNKIKCTTKLLGEHNILNLLAGASVGKALGLTFEEIAKGISKVEPIPHRLNIINPGTGIIIIDDAFNSNPDGARAALDVISQFKEGNKIIVTPGMVELGEQEEKANKDFGKSIAKTCDFAILVGQNRTKPIYEGLIDAGFSKEKIYLVNRLDEATQHIQKIAKPKDVVLFENDLPDTYDE